MGCHKQLSIFSGVTESLIFIILGVMLVNDYASWLDFNVGFAGLSLLLCIVARFAGTHKPLAGAQNRLVDIFSRVRAGLLRQYTPQWDTKNQ